MEMPEDLLKELNWNERWLTDIDKHSAWYREYLAKLFQAFDETYKNK